MLKNLKVKLTIFISLVAMFLTMGQGVYAKDLKFKAILNEDTAGSSNYTARLMTIVKKYNNPTPSKKWESYDWKSNIRNSSADKPVGTSVSYDQYSIIFHNNYLTKYEDGFVEKKESLEKSYIKAGKWDNPYAMNIYYDIRRDSNGKDIVTEPVKGDSNIDFDSFWNSLQSIPIHITGYNTGVPTLKINRHEGFELVRFRTDRPSKDDNTTLITEEWILDSQALNSVIGKFGEIEKIFFSMGTATNGGPDQYKWTEEGTVVHYDSAYDFFWTLIPNFHPKNRGFKIESQTIVNGSIYQLYTGSSTGSFTGGSAANLYDNTLIIPFGEINPRKVQVNYIYKDQTTGNYTTFKTETPNVGGKGAYTITPSTYNNNGYQYMGGVKATSLKSIDDASNLVKSSSDSWNWKSRTATVAASDKQDYTVINLYYEKREVIENHVDSSGKNLFTSAITNIGNEESKTLNSKSTPLYVGENKYNYIGGEYLKGICRNKVQSTNPSTTWLSDKTKITIPALPTNQKLVHTETNVVNFKYEYEPARKIYIRHLDQNGNVLLSELTNSNEAYKEASGNWKKVKNGYSQRKVKSGNPGYVLNDSSFNEVFEIDKSDIMKISKSLTVQSLGKEYEYLGYQMGTDNNSAKAIGNRNNSTRKTKNIVAILSDADNYVYIDFYYKVKSNVPPDDTSTSYVPGKDPNDPTDPFNPTNPDKVKDPKTCEIVYIPSGENLKPYLVAPSFKSYNMIYDIDTIDANGNIKYKLLTFDVYRVESGKVKNGDNSNETGILNGKEKEKNAVFSGEYDKAVTADINKINDYILKKTDEINTVLQNAGVKGGYTKSSDYINSSYDIPTDRYNGLREPSGEITYKLVNVVKNGSKNIIVTNETNTNATTNNAKINVFTPLIVGKPIVKSINSVNHSNKDDVNSIQKNTEFTLTPTIDVNGVDNKYGPINTTKYLQYYIVILDFDIKLTNSIPNYPVDSEISAGTPIIIKKGGNIKAIATSGANNGDLVSQYGNAIKVVGVTYNMSSNTLLTKVKEDLININKGLLNTSEYIDPNYIKPVGQCEETATSRTHNNGGFLEHNMKDDSHYFADIKHYSINIGRIYDFKITDCSDIDFKSVFRKTEDNKVNVLTGVKYFSGTRALDIYGLTGSTVDNNKLNDRTDLGTTPKKILPLGPYKNTTLTYINAPKMGYRISYDLKTSGMYTPGDTADKPVRTIRISPSYYYISKDGKTLNTDIKLYYKNASGRYIDFTTSAYTIYFKPKDGYRSIYNQDVTNDTKYMSEQLQPLQIGSTSFTLNKNMMSINDNNFIQAWYGEFKLPNSTIAVPKQNGDVNNPLTNGYIGVVFNIECVDKQNQNAPDTDDIVVGYNTPNKSVSDTNTTQWDYEGFLGVRSGSTVNGQNIRLQLEKGIWEINTQDIYEKIRGTVTLFDIDNRAANDFE